MSSLNAVQQALANKAAAAAQQKPAAPVPAATVVVPVLEEINEADYTGEKPVEKLSAKRTYVHQVAGACTHLENGKKLSFHGKPGGFGYYTTDIRAEIDWLESLARAHASQVTRLREDPITHMEEPIVKPADPALKQAAYDATLNSQRFFDPAASAAVENIGSAIAAGAAADQSGN